jgi:hypothetical protein
MFFTVKLDLPFVASLYISHVTTWFLQIVFKLSIVQTIIVVYLTPFEYILSLSFCEIFSLTTVIYTYMHMLHVYMWFLCRQVLNHVQIVAFHVLTVYSCVGGSSPYSLSPWIFRHHVQEGLRYVTILKTTVWIISLMKTSKFIFSSCIEIYQCSKFVSTLLASWSFSIVQCSKVKQGELGARSARIVFHFRIGHWTKTRKLVILNALVHRQCLLEFLE